MPKYNCIGCGQVHDDNDYSKEDGDILIDDITLSDKRIKVEIPGVGWVWVFLENDVQIFVKKLMESGVHGSEQKEGLFGVIPMREVRKQSGDAFCTNSDEVKK